MPSTLKITLILVLIIVFARFKLALSTTLFASAAILGFLFHLSIPEIAVSFVKGATHLDTLLLAASLLLILFFSALMKETGNMSRTISALQEIFHDARVTVATIPAVIGVLPILGGAMLSAPLVAEASDQLKLSPERRTFLNYWFRHVWEYCLPTYPGIIMASTLMDVPIAKIALMNLPLTIAAIATGIFFGFQSVGSSSSATTFDSSRHWVKSLWGFMGNLSPFFLVLLLTLYFRIHLAYSLAAASLAVILYYRFSGQRFWRLAKVSFSLEIVLLIWGIMIFKEILVVSGAMTSIATELSQIGLPPLILFISLPFILGLITGYGNAMVGLSFPILLPFFQDAPHTLAYLMIAYGSGFCGALLSPTHACLVMTLEFYKAEMGKVFRMLFLPVAIVFCTGLVTLWIAVWMNGGK